ncbi:MAG: efflux RND transporter permease subunit [Planctomycetes bacterium]|nr:efflux RND transporter permease subunit [Planctomycetota bacterium]
MSPVNEPAGHRGMMAWFAQNHVAANVLMLTILVGGAISLTTNKVEIFPDMSVDIISINVPYLGATPAEAEEGICLRVEEAVAGIDGVKKLRSFGLEGSGLVMVELDTYIDAKDVLDDVKAAVDRITTFPRETEKAIITELTMRYHVMSLVLYGDVEEATLKELAQEMRDELTALPGITQIEIVGVRDYEISIEVSEETLRRHRLTFDDVSRAVADSSLDLPGGSLKTAGGEVLIRTQGQRYRGSEFEQIVVLAQADGTEIRLGDIATVVDGFEDSDLAGSFDGQRSVQLKVFRVGEQNLLEIVEICEDYLAQNRANLPAGVSVATWFDRSKMLRSRIDLLTRNAWYGLAFVFVVLALFLDLRLAFWTTLGIPISFMGAFWMMPYWDTSINMMSLFGFILALGIVVDDAIVVGENVFAYRQRGMSHVDAAIAGVKEIALPVTMAVLTTMVAFVPLLCISGVWGKFVRMIPIVVISVLAFSLVEALLILPAHLSRGHPIAAQRGGLGPIGRFQGMIRKGLDAFVDRVFEPFVQRAVAWRYLTISVALAILILTVGFVSAGFLRFSLLPKVEADNVWASLSMPRGTSVDQTRKVVDQLEEAAHRVRDRVDAEWRGQPREQTVWARLFGGNDRTAVPAEQSLFTHIATSIGEQPFTRGDAGGPPTRADRGGHAAEVNIELLDGETRGNRFSSERIARLWREEVGEIPGVSSLTFTSSLFAGSDAISVEMSHRNFDELLAAVEEFKQTLGEYEGVIDITDTFEPGKLELKVSLKERGRFLGLTQADLARQVRQGFYGDEVQRIQRGRDDVRIMVRYPREHRRSMADMEAMRIRLEDGTEIPFGEVANVSLGRGYAIINRANRRRIVSVTADVDQAVANGNEVIADLQTRVFPALAAKYPGLTYDFEGEQRDQREIAKSLGRAVLLSLLAMMALLALQFRSYWQPLIIMSAIPFGIVGAVAGHVIMGFQLSMMSLFGIVALTGVVVNDSLLMVDLANRERRAGLALPQVIKAAVTRRFRPILLTTLTTFCGLIPIMLEKSLQAHFLIPMAISLAFGVLFATVITLILVPSLYMILEDFLAGFRRMRHLLF